MTMIAAGRLSFRASMIALLLCGCGSAPANQASGESGSTAVVQPAAWADLSFGERQQYMKDTVMPEMRGLFAQTHPDFGCKSCHGDNAASVNWAMPNTLAPLDPQRMPFESDVEDERNAALWMKETVVPAMARLLDATPFDPATGQGFGCFSCHAKKLQ